MFYMCIILRIINPVLPLLTMQAVVDAINLKSSIGLHSIDTYCTIRTNNWEGGRSVMVTEAVNSVIARGTGTAFASWEEIFTLPVYDLNSAAAAAAAASTETNKSHQSGITLECSDKGVFSLSYGRVYLTQSELIGSGNYPEKYGDIQLHSCVVGGDSSSSSSASSSSSSSSNNNADPHSLVTIRIMTCLVDGGAFRLLTLYLYTLTTT